MFVMRVSLLPMQSCLEYTKQLLSKRGESFIMGTHHFQVIIILDAHNYVPGLKLQRYLKKVVRWQKSVSPTSHCSEYNVESHYCHCWKMTVTFVVAKHQTRQVPETASCVGTMSGMELAGQGTFPDTAGFI